MNIKLCYLYLTDKLNKLSSNYSQYLNTPAVVRAINEAQYYWMDERLKIEESTKTVQRELQFLIVQYSPELISSQPLYNEYKLADNYYHPSLLEISVRTPNCTFFVENDFIENANISTYLQDEMTKPDYDWEQIFSTIRSDKLVVYKDTKPNYDIDNIVFYYYRRPNLVDIATGHKGLDGNLTKDIDLEFSESASYEILDIAAKIIAGNINDQIRFQYNSQLTQEFK